MSSKNNDFTIITLPEIDNTDIYVWDLCFNATFEQETYACMKAFLNVLNSLKLQAGMLIFMQEPELIKALAFYFQAIV